MLAHSPLSTLLGGSVLSHETQIFIQLILLYFLWVMGPLVPAVLIYKLFPDTSVSAEGPLAGLTVRATGAFAAYLLTFLIAYPLNLKIHNVFGSQLKAVWKLEAELIATDDDGQPIEYAPFYKSLQISLSPSLQEIAGRKVELQIPLDGEGREWPKITFQIPNFGGTTINPSEYMEVMEIDEFNKEVKIRSVIPIQRIKPISFGQLGRGQHN